jgi:ABC-type glycerol-3-phosphate transport system permease component
MCLTAIAQLLKSFSQNKNTNPDCSNFIKPHNSSLGDEGIIIMEDETREFLVRILNTVAIVLVWMIANVFIGIYKGYAFFEEQADWKNYVYYVFLATSFIFLVIHLKRKWKL